MLITFQKTYLINIVKIKSNFNFENENEKKGKLLFTFLSFKDHKNKQYINVIN